MKKWIATAVVVTALSSPSAQSLEPLSAEDTLKVQTAAVLDLSEDGRLAAVAILRLFDNAEINHRRYGDPTYFAPAMVELRVIDTRTARATRLARV